MSDQQDKVEGKKSHGFLPPIGGDAQPLGLPSERSLGDAHLTQKSQDNDVSEIEIVKPTKDGGLAYLDKSTTKPGPGSTQNKVLDSQLVTKDEMPKTEAASPEKPAGKPGPPPPQPRIAFMDLYKYSSSWDVFLVRSGLFFSLAAGAIQPTYGIVIGKVVEMFNPDLPTDEKRELMISFIGTVTAISIATYVTSYLGYALMQISSERVSFKLRARYLSSLMKQEIAFFETQQIEALPSKMSEYFTHIADGSGEKTGQMISTIGATCSGIIIGLAICPYYALCLIVYLPFASILMQVLKGIMIKGVMQKFGQNAKLGGFTEEMLSSLKLIISFGKEDKKLKEYEELALQSYTTAKKAAVLGGFMGGAFYAIIIGFSCFAWCVGYAMIKYEVYNPRFDRPIAVGDIVGTYQALMFGMFTVISIQNLVPAVIRALTVGKSVLDVIDRCPEIQSPKDANEVVTDIKIQDSIKFENVAFRYPTAPEHVKDVFQGVSFKVLAGTSTAIVGPSGSGKSTIVQMINRFYDPLGGEIIYGETPLKKVELSSLRDMIGWVGQEPVLIVGTIKENLLYGNKDATDQDIERAVNLANAHFIYQMEKGLQTYVGSSTVLNLSGGQKQRIAIARALIKKPQILVLDEATSALDPKSEAEVQNAILNVQKQQKGNLTIIMIAHRLQTIQTADNLLYLENPKSVLAGAKGSPEYTDIMDRLKRTNYAHQADAEAEDQKSAESEESDPDQEDKHENQSAHSYASNNSMAMDKDARRASRAIQKEIKRASQLTPAAKAAIEAEKSQAGTIKVATRFISTRSGWGRLFEYYKPTYVVVIMVILALINSCSMPFIAYCIIQLQWAMYSKDAKEPNLDWESEVHTYLIAQACGVFVILLVNGFERSLFGVMGEKLTLKIRMSLIEEIVHKQISWFDRQDRAPGILTQIISGDIASLNGMTSEVLVTLFELVCVVIIGLVAGIYFCWQATILCFLLSPIMIIGMYMMSTMQFGNKGGRFEGNETEDIGDYAKANALLSDVVINYRTIISLGQKNVDEIQKKFEKLLNGPMVDTVKQANKAGAYYGLGVAGRTLYISIVFLLAMEFLVYRLDIDSSEVFTATYLLFFTYMSIGGQAANVPSIKKAKASAIPVFSIIDEKSELDIRRPEHRALKEVKEGKIEFIDTTFNYPTRAQKVMDKFNIEIPAGAKIALVGHSGCGKSTLTNILLRFYNINEGKVLIDGKDLDQYNVHALRDQCGYVMQEPVLFNADIKTNIRFGKPDATDEEVYIAAQKANALQFIESNSDDLTDEQKLAKLEEEYSKVFDSLKMAYPALAEIGQEYQDKSKDVKQILINLMTMMPDNQKSKAIANLSEFKDAVAKNICRYGAGWEDVVIQFEWHDILIKMLGAESTLSAELKTDVKMMLEKYSELYGVFNESCILDASKKGIKGLEELAIHVREQKSQYKMTVVNKRFQELQYLAIDKKRDVDGKFTLHEGFNKDCGLKGGKLSGGQKQRIAIARALIKDPRILILDEATSALDEQSQEVVQQALDRAMEGRTSIVIAHRLSTIRNCDILFVLGNGKVMESGSYDELASDYNSHFNVLKAGMEN